MLLSSVLRLEAAAPGSWSRVPLRTRDLHREFSLFLFPLPIRARKKWTHLRFPIFRKSKFEKWVSKVQVSNVGEDTQSFTGKKREHSREANIEISSVPFFVEG